MGFFLAFWANAIAWADTTFSFDNIPINGATTILCAEQDARGMVWMGTDCGLYAYDGYRTFACFSVGTPQNVRVHALLASEGKLYLGTDNGLQVFDTQTHTYLSSPSGSTTDVRALALMGNRLLLGGAKGVDVFDTSSGKMLTAERVATPNVYSLLPTTNGRVLVGTIDGLFEISNRKATRINITSGRQPLVNAMIAVNDNDHKRGYWIGTEGALYRYQNGTFENLPAVSGNSIKSLAKDNQSLYVATDNGLFVLGRNGTTQHLRHDSRQEGSIADNIVWTVRSFPSGLLVLGTGNGLSCRRSMGAFSLLTMSQLTGSGDGNRIYALLHAPNGTTWMGGSNGLIRTNRTLGRDSERNSLTAWYRLGDKAHPLPHNRVRSITSDTDGDIVVSTDHGINIYERASGRFRNFIVGEKSGQYTATWAYDALDDGQGRYWISSYMGGIFIVAKQKITASDGHVVADAHLLSTLQSIHADRLVDDGNGYVYATSYEGGIDVIDKQTLKVRHLLNDFADAVTTDGQGQVYVAHQGIVERFSTRGQKPLKYTLTSNGTTRVTDMAIVGNQLWVLIGNTCSVFQPDGSSTRFFLPEQKPLSMVYDKADGLVLLGCNDAIATIRPDHMTTSSRARRLTLTGIEVNGKAWQGPLAAADDARTLTFDHDQNNIRLLLSDFSDHTALQPVYAYQLKGIDHAWQYITDGDLSVAYNALPHGRYTLSVCVADGYGNPSETVLEVVVVVRPPWYLTIWAKTFYLLLLVMLLVWGVHTYIEHDRRRKERLEHKQILEQSKARAAFYANLSQQLKKPIGRILGIVYGLLPDEKDSTRTQRLNEARQDVTIINELVRQSLDFEGKTTVSDHNAKNGVSIDLVDFFRRTLDDERSQSSSARGELRFKTDTLVARTSIDMTTLQPLVRHLFRLTVQNLAPKQVATCSLMGSLDNRTLVLTLHTDFQTIHADQLPYVFYRYGLPVNEASTEQDKGINQLSLLSDFVRSRGGEAKAESNAEHGTTITLTFPNCQLSVPQSASQPSAVRETKPQPTTDDADYKLLAKITQAVEEHLADTDLNVTRLQEIVGIGDKLLYRRVKQMTGRTPVDFIRHIRMQRASLLLREGRFSVSEVMYMVGFSSSSYFSKCFQKVYGITPAEYMRKAPTLG